MLRSLYGKLAIVLMGVFFAIGAAFVLATERMLGGRRLLELGTELVIGAVAFSLLAALIVFNLLTRRLRLLAAEMDAFRAGGFTQPKRFASANPRGDEIDRLGAAFQEMSERIAAQLNELEHNDEQRRELLANVSHDLRTPLASMQGYLETLLLKHGTLSPEEERNYLEVAAKHSERLGKLVRDLFELTKLEAHEVRLQEEVFPLTELVQDVVQKFQLPAERRGLRLEHHFDGTVPAVRADIGLIERVLENLIENAMRHTLSGGAVRVELEPLGDRIGLRVRDTGQGIPREELSNIFERYYRVDRGEFGSAGSTGLGLAITRRIVELHGGQVRVESTLGEGTTFSFDLPAAQGGAAAPPLTAAGEQRVTP
jgi:signal transduction histidine kinase